MKNKGFGLAIAFVLALCAMFLGTFFPIIGSSVFALILGIVLNELVDLPENSRPGLNWSGKKLLQYSIIFMGFSLPIATVASTGLSSLKISLPTITVAVVAAAFSYSKAAGEMATIVKLTRALMIVPVCLGLIGLKWYRSKQQGRNKGMLKKIIPWFIIWFIVASILSSIGLLPKVVLPYLKDLSHLFMAMALVGIGSKVSWKQFRAAGAAPLLVGLIAWFCVAGSSLVLQMLFY